MKVHFSCDDSTPEGREEIIRLTKSADIALALWHINHTLRTRIKRKIGNRSDADTNWMVNMFFESINDIFEEFNVNPDEFTNS